MLTTRCTYCNGAFRISRVQLETRHGKVRCGRCSRVFDARRTLRELPDDTDSGDAPAEFRSGEPSAPGLAAVASTSARGETSTSARGETGIVPATPAPEYATASKAPQLAPDTSRSAGNRPAERARAGWPGAALLLLLLAAQIAFHFRGEITLVYPEARAQLLALCEPFGCDLPLPRLSQLMSIENSDLQADPSNPAVMVLSATLRNRAVYAQAYPALELTLTDAQDRPLARRVMWVGDYLARAAQRDGGFPAATEIATRVRFEAPELKPTGYRLYLFYP